MTRVLRIALREGLIALRLHSRRTEWSVRVFHVPSLTALPQAVSRDCPKWIVTRQSLAPIDTQTMDFVADPFLVCASNIEKGHGPIAYLFAEVMPRWRPRGFIGCWHLEPNGDARYLGRALFLRHHLSHPYVFSVGGAHYMVPEQGEAKTVSLYRCISWPLEWAEHSVLLTDIDLADPVVFWADDHWHLIGTSGPNYSTLRHFISRFHDRGYIESAHSPLFTDRVRARQGGSMVSGSGDTYRFAQSSIPRYGSSVALYGVDIEGDVFDVSVIPEFRLVPGGRGSWNGSGMHHVSATPVDDGRWLAAVDGRSG